MYSVPWLVLFEAGYLLKVCFVTQVVSRSLPVSLVLDGVVQRGERGQ